MLMTQVNVNEWYRQSLVSDLAKPADAGLTPRAGLGQMAETINRDPFYQDRPGYEGMLNDVSLGYLSRRPSHIHRLTL